MAFEFTYEEKPLSIEEDINELIAMRFGDNPVSWYNSKNKHIQTIVNSTGISYPKIMKMRRSPEFKEAAEDFLTNNGREVDAIMLRQAGVLGEKRQIVRHDPRASKHVIWGELVLETEDEVVIRKYPPLKNEFANKSKKELIAMVIESRESDGSSDGVSDGVQGSTGGVGSVGVNTEDDAEASE